MATGTHYFLSKAKAISTGISKWKGWFPLDDDPSVAFLNPFAWGNTWLRNIARCTAQTGFGLCGAVVGIGKDIWNLPGSIRRWYRGESAPQEPSLGLTLLSLITIVPRGLLWSLYHLCGGILHFCIGIIVGTVLLIILTFTLLYSAVDFLLDVTLGNLGHCIRAVNNQFKTTNDQFQPPRH